MIPHNSWLLWSVFISNFIMPFYFILLIFFTYFSDHVYNYKKMMKKAANLKYNFNTFFAVNVAQQKKSCVALVFSFLLSPLCRYKEEKNVFPKITQNKKYGIDRVSLLFCALFFIIFVLLVTFHRRFFSDFSKLL